MAFPVIGIFQYFVFIPIIPEMLERVTVELQAVEGQDPELDGAIYDKVNDAYGFIYALAMFIGPLIGGQMYTIFNGPKTSDYIAISNLFIGMILFIFNCGPFVFQEHKEFYKKLNDLKEQAEAFKQQQEEQTGGDDDTSINNQKVPVLTQSQQSYRARTKSLKIRPNIP